VLINFRINAVFCSHAATASRWLEPILQRREFERLGSRHEGPRNLTTLAPPWVAGQWWDADPGDFDYWYVVRNHGDAVFSWWWANRHDHKESLASPKFVANFFRKYPRLFTSSRRLWRFVWDLPGGNVMRFENLYQDVGWMLKTYDLPPLEPHEKGVDPGHRTQGKPRDHWSKHFTEDALGTLDHNYRTEATRLGYRLR
jgi:hypothetical protein